MIKKITLEDIKDYVLSARKEELYFSNSTELFGYFVNGAMVGFSGFILYKNKMVFKNNYVLPEHRGNGYFKKMLDHCFSVARELGIKNGEANCTSLSINEYLKRGFTEQKQYKTCTKVIHENL